MRGELRRRHLIGYSAPIRIFERLAGAFVNQFGDLERLEDIPGRLHAVAPRRKKIFEGEERRVRNHVQ